MIIENQALKDLDKFINKIKKYLTFRAERVAADHRRNGVTTGDVMEVIDTTRFALGREFFDLDESVWTKENYRTNLTRHIYQIIIQLDRPIQENLPNDFPLERHYAYPQSWFESGYMERCHRLPRIFENLNNQLSNGIHDFFRSGL